MEKRYFKQRDIVTFWIVWFDTGNLINKKLII